MKTIIALILLLNIISPLELLGQNVIWEKTLGVNSLKGLNFCQNDVGTVFAGTDHGILISSNNGILWEKFGLDTFYIEAVAVDSMGRVFAGGGKNYGEKGIYRSLDSGVSWNLMLSTTEILPPNAKLNHSVTSLLVIQNGIILSGTEGFGICRSIDNGETWIRIGPGEINQDVYSLCKSDNGIVYAGTKDGVYRSTDFGLTWSHKPPVRDFAYALVSGKGDEVFAGVSYITGSSGVFRSTNKGDSWQKYGLQDQAVISLAMDKRGTLLAVAVGNDRKVYRKDNIDSVWVQISNNLPTYSCQSVIVASDGHALVGLWNFGIYRSTNTLTYVENETIYPSEINITNYPNPFNPSTKIKFTVPNTDRVLLRVIDILGREVNVLIDGPIPKGNYEFNWDAYNLPSGIYIACLYSGNFLRTKRMLLLR